MDADEDLSVREGPSLPNQPQQVYANMKIKSRASLFGGPSLLSLMMVGSLLTGEGSALTDLQLTSTQTPWKQTATALRSMWRVLLKGNIM